MKLPWLFPSWQKISVDYANLHHSQLISGDVGIGKMQFALRLSKLLLCSNPVLASDAQNACGQCQNCHLYQAGTHPDLHVLSTESNLDSSYCAEATPFALRYLDAAARAKRNQASQVIAIDQVRQLIKQFSELPHISERKVSIIMTAESMNLNAANALLKLLEEPPENSYIILVTAMPGKLLPTIRSRLFKQRLPTPSIKQAQDWLSQHSIKIDTDNELIHAPLLYRYQYQQGVLALKEEIRQTIKSVFMHKVHAVDAAVKLSKHNFSDVMTELDLFTIKLIRYLSQSSAENPPKVSHFTAKSAFIFYDLVVYYHRLEKESINKQLALEALFLNLQGA